ncbi:MAG: C10 family peptidase [Candidatus Zixiibacteriota bacterium]|nr:MAG: C10 family peptidase [candidate division Zixibacteria bacterium]
MRRLCNKNVRAGRPESGASTKVISLAASLFIIGTTLTHAELATRAEADQVCQNGLTKMVYQKGSWAGSAAPEVTGITEIKSGDTLLARIYNISPRGFIVVPSLKEMVPVKAYSDESNLYEDNEGGFFLLLKDVLSSRVSLYTEVYGDLNAIQPDAGEAVFGRGQKNQWEKLSLPSDEYLSLLDKGETRLIGENGPLLTSKWHQHEPYYNACPMGDGDRCVVGCTNTAIAQIMNYWQWPDSGLGSSSYSWMGDASCGGWVSGGMLSADYSDPYDWDHILDSCLDCTPQDSAALAELSYEVGAANETLYGACGSGAWTTMAIKTLPKHFKYNPGLEQQKRVNHDLEGWFNLIKDQIDGGLPILYEIYRHSIVCDGWREQTEGQYEYHMNYGWRKSYAQYTAWYVFDSLFCFWVEPDSLCPSDWDKMIVNIFPQTEPIIRSLGMTLDDSPGDGDGHAETGESVKLSVRIKNHGAAATGISGTMSTDDAFVSVTSPASSYEDNISWGDEASSLTQYELSVDPSCPDPHIAVLQMQYSSNESYSSTDTLLLYIGNTQGFSDDTEGGPGYWAHRPVIPSYVDDWHMNDFRSYSGTTSWKAGDPGEKPYRSMADGGLITPPLLLPFNAALSFWQWLDMEKYGDWAYDGGVVMISSGDGDWSQITPVGGYTDSLASNCNSAPFPEGTKCFSGAHDWHQVVFDLSAYTGVVQLMLRAFTDANIGTEGWHVDDVVVGGVLCGDADGSGSVNLLDVTFIINYLYKSGPAPDPEEAADADGSGSINLLDVTHLINYLYKSGPLPVC